MHLSDGKQVPDVVDELRACQERMAEIEKAAGKNCKLAWTTGNHDLRYNTRLATTAPEFCKVHGFALEDHFSPRWNHAMAVFVNGDIVVKHRFKGGQHATFNNALWSGKTVITGHLHSQRISPIRLWGNALGCRYRLFGLHPWPTIRLHRIQSVQLGAADLVCFRFIKSNCSPRNSVPFGLMTGAK